MDKNKFSQLLVSLRKEKKLYQQNIADIFKVTVQAVSKWENGESIPDIETLEKISEFYNISINNLLEGNKIFITKKETIGEKKINLFQFIESIILLLLICITLFVKFCYTDLYLYNVSNSNSYIYYSYYEIISNITGWWFFTFIIILLLFLLVVLFGFFKSILMKRYFYLTELILTIATVAYLLIVGTLMYSDSSVMFAVGYILLLIILSIHLILILIIKELKIKKNS